MCDNLVYIFNSLTRFILRRIRSFRLECLFDSSLLSFLPIWELTNLLPRNFDNKKKSFILKCQIYLHPPTPTPHTQPKISHDTKYKDITTIIFFKQWWKSLLYKGFFFICLVCGFLIRENVFVPP